MNLKFTIIKTGEKFMKTFRVTLIFSCFIGLLFAGCAHNENTTGNTGNTVGNGGNTAVSSKNLKLAFVTNNASDYWTIARKGVEKADGELANVDVEFKLPADGTAAEQRRIIDDLLSKGINGIAISPVDPDNQTQFINDTAKKALVITQDSDAPGSERALYIGTDNVAAGRQAGELIKEALPNGGKIMLFVGKSDARNAAERAQGIKEALKDSKIEIIDTRTDDTDRARALVDIANQSVRGERAAAMAQAKEQDSKESTTAIAIAEGESAAMRARADQRVVAYVDEILSSLATLDDGVPSSSPAGAR